MALGNHLVPRVVLWLLIWWVGLVTTVQAQITPGGSGTVVGRDGNTFNITGGTQAGRNLFHTFQQFGLNQGQIANFFSNPAIANILARVNGGSASYINGLIQVLGGRSNLFLMNPSGIVFGPNAALNVPAAFTATTADRILFPGGSFNAYGNNNYAQLVGEPIGFAFDRKDPAAIINAGNLQANSVSLIAGQVINTGTITGNNITVAAVPGTSFLRISQPGQILSLEIDANRAAGMLDLDGNLPITRLPELLTGAGTTSVTSSGNNTVQLAGVTSPISVTSGSAIISGVIDASNTQGVGGTVQVLGQNVSLLQAEINASGSLGGGTIFVGGDYQGQGSLPRAESTFISRDSRLIADAINSGPGGKVIVWADRTTEFFGSILARGEQGGFVETSGKVTIDFAGSYVDAGRGGTWLIDPTDVTIGLVEALAITTTLNLGTDVIISTTGPGSDAGNITINAGILGNLLGDATLTFQANNNIIMNEVSITSIANKLNVIFQADSDSTGGGRIEIRGNASIQTNGGKIILGGGSDPVNNPAISLDTGKGGVELTQVSGNSPLLDAQGGNIIIRGRNDATGGSSNDGIRLGGATLKTTGTGTIFIEGTGTSSSTINSEGIDFNNSGTLIQTGGGEITLIGTARSTGSDSEGVDFDSSADIQTNGGKLTVIGSAAGTNNGILTVNSVEMETKGGEVKFSSTEPINLQGTIETGGGTLNVDGGFITVGSTSDITAGEINFNSLGNITINDELNSTSSPGKSINLKANNDIFINADLLTKNGNITLQSNLDGVTSGAIEINNSTLQSQGGAITLGNALTKGSIEGQAGVLIFNSTISAGTGNIQVIGESFAGTGNENFGVRITGSGSEITTSGNLDIQGTSNAVNGDGNRGIILGNSAQINVSGSGTVTLTGTGGNANTGNDGILLDPGTAITTNSGGIQLTGTGRGFGVDNNGIRTEGTLQTVSGTIQLTGIGASNNAGFGDGVDLRGGTIQATGAGNIILTGTSGVGNGPNFDGIDFVGTTVTSNGGDITLTGISLGNNNSDNRGVLIDGGGLQTTGHGKVTVTGISGTGIGDNNGAVIVTGTAALKTESGAINLTGTAQATGVNSEAVRVNNGTVQTTLGGAIQITANAGELNTVNGTITTNTTGNSGDITLLANDGEIKSGAINSSSSTSKAGNILLQAIGNVQFSTLDAQGAITGGTVSITTENFVQATGTFLAKDGTTASIASNGNITVTHGGNDLTALVVGDASVNGTVGGITSGTTIILPTQSYLGTQTVGNIRFITGGASSPTSDPTSPPPLPSAPELSETDIATDLIVTAPPEAEPGGIDETPILETSLVKVPEFATAGETILALDTSKTEQFANSLGVQSINDFTQLAQIERALAEMAATTGKRPALLYINSTDRQLNLILIPPQGTPQKLASVGANILPGQTIFRGISAANQAALMPVVQDFLRGIKDPRFRNQNTYLPAAQQLYNWMIAPIKTALEINQIDTIVLVPDLGLRALPYAALHDGQQFLVEQYSLGQIPSINLVDMSYRPVQGMAVLAMGAAQFQQQPPLPGVPVELQTIQREWPGQVFLNQDFTVPNLVRSRQQTAFGLLHLATHAEFRPGAIQKSYIQFWDQTLWLDQLKQLPLQKPPIELMVLSACRTAVGDQNAELGFAGLAVAAGVKSVLASTWYISDEGTLVFMTEFYRQLQNSPIKAEALRQTQMQLLRGGVTVQNRQLRRPGVPPISLPVELQNLNSANLRHPYYWAAFSLIGSPW